MRIDFVFRDIPNERILNYDKARLPELAETLNDPNIRFLFLQLDNRRVMINKDDIIKIEWSMP